MLDDLRFSRFMFEEKSTTTNDEFFEISNTGDIMAVLNGWTIRKNNYRRCSVQWHFYRRSISAGSVIISPDANSVKAMGATMILDADDVMNFPVWLPNSGATIQL